MVDLGAVCQCCGQILLKSLQFGLQGTDAAVKLTVGEEVRDVGAEASVGEAIEVSLAAEAGPLREDERPGLRGDGG
jgi:hypothetical protein